MNTESYIKSWQERGFDVTTLLDAIPWLIILAYKEEIGEDILIIYYKDENIRFEAWLNRSDDRWFQVNENIPVADEFFATPADIVFETLCNLLSKFPTPAAAPLLFSENSKIRFIAKKLTE